MVWSSRSTTPANPGAEQEETFLREQVARLRRRQENGELLDDLDPACVLLALFAAASATITLPRVTAAVRTEDQSDEEFTRRYADRLGKPVRHLIGQGGDELVATEPISAAPGERKAEIPSMARTRPTSCQSRQATWHMWTARPRRRLGESGWPTRGSRPARGEQSQACPASARHPTTPSW
jgi:hypothetical protein